MSNKNINDVCEILGVDSGRSNSSDKKLSLVEAINAKKEKERKEKKIEKKTFKGKITMLFFTQFILLVYLFL
jgi:hypothetical protein